MPRWTTASSVSPRTWLSIRAERVAIPDPQRLVHLQFRRFAGCPICDLGVEAAPRALLHPRAWLSIIRAIAVSVWSIVRGKAKPPALHQAAGRFGLPADFLIASDGRVLACHYGEHAYDQWSVDELLAQCGAAVTGAHQRLALAKQP
jgi:hypothetical protein